MQNKYNLYIRGCLVVFLLIIIMPGLLYLFLLLYGKYYTYNRTFVADVKSVGYEISFTEIENDSILAFSFIRKGDNKKVIDFLCIFCATQVRSS